MVSAASLLTVKTDPSSLAVGVSVLGQVVIRQYYKRRLAPVTKKISKSRVSGLEPAVVPLWYCCGITIPSVYVVTRVLDFANYALPGGRVWATAAGGLASALSLWLFARSHDDLGNLWSFTLQIREKHKLVTSGVYSYVRHPMYTSIFLMCAGIGFLAPNLVVNASVLGSAAAFFFIRIPKEERMMIEEFGEDYQTYKADVSGIVPKIKIWPQKKPGKKNTF